ncbi:MAG: cell division regulator GpsB [Beduini sp.]|uniref:cell division regulator GpsB n=1 Tax=Beduini sp. TaxID=1922300 RepID=UPI0011C8FC7B
MDYKIQLTPKKILNKEFKVDFKGYNSAEVDYFLDTILADYENFAKIIEFANKELEELENENKKLKEEIAQLSRDKSVAEESVQNLEEQLSPQVDILKRLSLLEKAVFGNRSAE